MKDSLRRAFAMKPFAKAAAQAALPRTNLELASSYAARVRAHTAALVALMDATLAVSQAVGVKTTAAMEEHATSLGYLKQLSNSGTKAMASNPYWGARKASARTPDAKPGQSIHHRVVSRTK